MKKRLSPLGRKVVVGAVVVTTCLGGASWWALDRFVIDHVQVSSVTAYEASTVASEITEQIASTTNSAQITITTGVVGEGDDQATYYVADIVLDDITQLRSAFANDQFGLNITQTPSEIASSVGAALAINGDYHGFRETGIVIRNGVVYRDEGARQGAVIYLDGTMEVYDETSTSAQELLDAGAWITLSFGPALVDDGAVVEGIEDVEVDTNVGNHSIQGDQPRTAIGMISANHYILVVVDGRSSESAGVTLPELAALMLELGATEAYNLDGGGSSTMVSEGELVNDPLGKGTERGTSDILWVA